MEQALIKVVAFGAPVAIATADPRQPAEYPWRKQTIKYFIKGDFQYPQEFKIAANQWNRTGVAPLFVPVKTQSQADLVAQSIPRERMNKVCSGTECVASATFGYRRFRTSKLSVIHKEKYGKGVSRKYVFVIIHELGHVLGLEHRIGPACSVMSIYSVEKYCEAFRDGENGKSPAYCGPHETDIIMAIEIYKKTTKKKYTPFCDAAWVKNFSSEE